MKKLSLPLIAVLSTTAMANMKPVKVTIEGTVSKKLVDKGSKSKRETLTLTNEEGQEFLLRGKNEPAIMPSANHSSLAKFLNRTVSCTGFLISEKQMIQVECK